MSKKADKILKFISIGTDMIPLIPSVVGAIDDAIDLLRGEGEVSGDTLDDLSAAAHRDVADLDAANDEAEGE